MLYTSTLSHVLMHKHRCTTIDPIWSDVAFHQALLENSRLNKKGLKWRSIRLTAPATGTDWTHWVFVSPIIFFLKTSAPTSRIGCVAAYDQFLIQQLTIIDKPLHCRPPCQRYQCRCRRLSRQHQDVVDTDALVQTPCIRSTEAPTVTTITLCNPAKNRIRNIAVS